MAIRAQQLEIFLAVVVCVTIYVVNFERNFARDRVYFRPAAFLAPLSVLLVNIPNDVTRKGSCTFSSVAINQPLSPFAKVLRMFCVALTGVVAVLLSSARELAPAMLTCHLQSITN